MAISNLNEYYQSIGQALPSVQERQGIASQAGIQNYIGSSDQNGLLLGYLQNHSQTQTPTLPTTIDSTSMGATNTPTMPTGSNAVSTYTPPNLAGAPLETLTEAEKAARAVSESGSSSLYNLYQGLLGESADTTAAYQSADITGLKTQLQGYNNDIKTKMAELQQFDVQNQQYQNNIENQTVPLGVVVGQQAEQARQAAITRSSKVAEIGLLNARVLATQGNIELATKTAEDAVAAKYAPIKEQIAIKEAQLKAMEPLWTSAEKKIAANQSLAIDIYKKKIDAKIELETYRAKASIDETAVSKMSSYTSSYSPLSSSSYTVKKTDEGSYALTNVAKALGISLESLWAMNPQLNANGDIKAGDVLVLPKVDPSVSGVYTGNAAVDSYIGNILNGNATLAQVPKELRTKVSIGMNKAGNGGYSPLASSRLTLASSRITSQFTNMPNYELTANGLPYLQRIDAALKTPGAVSDQDLLDSLVKLNTAGNAVTEAQVKLITGYRSFSDMASVFQNKFSKGGSLSTRQRKQIGDISKAIYTNYQTGYQPIYNQATKQLTDAGIPKAFWTIPDLNTLNAGAVSNLNFSTGGTINLSGFNFHL